LGLAVSIAVRAGVAQKKGSGERPAGNQWRWVARACTGKLAGHAGIERLTPHARRFKQNIRKEKTQKKKKKKKPPQKKKKKKKKKRKT